jgi:transcriptional regulator NrdR family protein
MNCPYCGHAETRTEQTRVQEEGRTVLRYRACKGCGKPFTTKEFRVAYVGRDVGYMIDTAALVPAIAEGDE